VTLFLSPVLAHNAYALGWPANLKEETTTCYHAADAISILDILKRSGNEQALARFKVLEEQSRCKHEFVDLSIKREVALFRQLVVSSFYFDAYVIEGTTVDRGTVFIIHMNSVYKDQDKEKPASGS
jgi:hypothetical protein